MSGILTHEEESPRSYVVTYCSKTLMVRSWHQVSVRLTPWFRKSVWPGQYVRCCVSTRRRLLNTQHNTLNFPHSMHIILSPPNLRALSVALKFKRVLKPCWKFLKLLLHESRAQLVNKLLIYFEISMGYVFIVFIPFSHLKLAFINKLISYVLLGVY